MKTSEGFEDIFSGDLIDSDVECTAEEFCLRCSLQTEQVLAFVHEGVLEPTGEDITHWRFKISSIRRVRTVMRLQRDLGVNLSGAALALELLDRIAELENRMAGFVSGSK